MSELLANGYLLAGVFFGVAFAYSAVGLGGGSSYTALLTLAGTPFNMIPGITLMLNVLASSMASLNFIRSGHLRWSLLGPFLLASVPAAYLGGSLEVEAVFFYWLLLASLALVVVRIYWRDVPGWRLELGRGARLGVSLGVGAVLGLLSGMLGIGGGIYLVPAIIVLGLGSTKEAAASGAVFVFINSVAGLAARLAHHPLDWGFASKLILAVLLGAALGSYLGASRLDARQMERWLGVIILVAMAFLLRRLLWPA